MATTSMCLRSMSTLSRVSRALMLGSARTRPSTYSYTTNMENKANEEKKQEEGKTDNQPPVEPAGPTELEAKLTEENEKLQIDLKDIKDKYMRSLAETENVRTRMKKQVDDAKVFGIQGFCKDLLEVADILNTATESTPKEELKNNTHLKTLFEGLTLTSSQLTKVFNKHGLAVIDPQVGEKFDPFFHEALFQVPTQETASSGNIAVIQKTGYKLHDRTIRPALVGVFK